MDERQDRRTAGVNRVAVARLVDICGRDQTVPAFEAESVELSGRGMHVRTPYLPPLGAPLVCRLEDSGREIVVEGVVAWQRDHEGGGEFGVQFTALDSGSVEALRGLCGLGEPSDEAPKAAKERAAEEAACNAAPSGMPVKLHIEGLGAPMKARVKTGGSRKLQVGSNLEFLKVGRGLEVEDVEHGARRGARIDAVSIAIDPKTQVPQLVVMLRYAGEDTTPEPSVVDDDEEEPVLSVGVGSPDLPATASEASAPASVDDPDEVDDDDGEPALVAHDGDDDDAAAMRGRVDAMAVNVGKAAQRASDRLGVAGTAFASSFGKWMKRGSAKISEMAARRGSAPKRRSTAPAPADPSAQPRRLRPQNAASPAEGMDPKKRRKMIVGATACGVLMLAMGAFALSGHGGKSASTVPPSAVAAAPVATMTPAPMAQAPAPAAPPMAAAPGAMGAVPALPGQRPGAVANVPLFGPTPMATLEPAPLGPAPDQIAAVPASAVSAAAVEERMDEDEKGSAADESFGTSKKSSSESDKEKKSPDAVAEAVKAWADGKLHLPLVHRLKLDKPGAALEGKKTASGFTVVIPGRKVEGGGISISKRDDRISEVKTKNGPGGAQVTFVFRSKVPGYKVRLKKSYVEFFISSPDGAK